MAPALSSVSLAQAARMVAHNARVNPAVWPLIGCVATVSGMAIGASYRALKYDNSLVWAHHANPEPWNANRTTPF